LIFSIQRFLEDRFSQRSLVDNDQYAVRMANLYGQRRSGESKAAFLKAMHRLQTIFFRGNSIDRRDEFEVDLLDLLDAKFLKKKSNSPPTKFPGGVSTERTRVRETRLSVRSLLEQFKRAVEGRAVDSFWKSRKKGRLQTNPETAGQGLLAVFLKGVLHARTGIVLREMASGVGWVDIALVLAATPHLMELKILRGSTTPGVTQLDTYMATEGRDEGWLVLFDTRKPSSRAGIPTTITVPAGTVRVVLIDVNPTPPSRR